MITPIYTKKEAAAFLKVSEKTIDRLILAGKLDSMKIGGVRRFTDRHLNQLIAESEKI